MLPIDIKYILLAWFLEIGIEIGIEIGMNEMEKIRSGGEVEREDGMGWDGMDGWMGDR